MVSRISIVVLITAAAGAAQTAGDAQRGQELFRVQNCVECHTVAGKGASSPRGPDLGVRRGRDFTPSSLATLMWNHAPAMWSAMEAQNVRREEMTDQNAADLFAFFYAAGFFEQPGDAGRGKALFSAKGCGACHTSGPGKPVGEWQAVSDAISLAHQMWNHASYMQEAMAKKKMRRPALTAQELRDLCVYVLSLPQHRGRPMAFTLASAAGGEELFKAKGCVECHTGKETLEGKLANQSLTGVAAEMWNHAPKMVRMPPGLTEDEMRRVISYIWARQFFDGTGNSARGHRVFTAKGCAGCHEGSSASAPALPKTGSRYSSPAIIASLWKHGPAMLAQMRQRNLSWPRFKASEMSDLVAYLNAPGSGRR